MTSLDVNTIQKVATLARLTIRDDEVPRYQKDLANILTLIEQINTVDTTNIEPMTHSQPRTQRLRHDTVTAVVDTNQKIALQKIAPQMELNLYLVPQVIEDVEDVQKTKVEAEAAEE